MLEHSQSNTSGALCLKQSTGRMNWAGAAAASASVLFINISIFNR